MFSHLTYSHMRSFNEEKIDPGQCTGQQLGELEVSSFSFQTVAEPAARKLWQGYGKVTPKRERKRVQCQEQDHFLEQKQEIVRNHSILIVLYTVQLKSAVETVQGRHKDCSIRVESHLRCIEPESTKEGLQVSVMSVLKINLLLQIE